MAVRTLLRRGVRVAEWNIGIANARLDDLAGSSRSATPVVIRPSVRWLHKPWFVQYQADPCLVEHGERLYLYYEELIFGSGKGRLRCTQLDTTGTPVRRSEAMIRLGHHAAYPYVFKYLDAFYCVPETAQAGRVALYRSEAPSGPWAFERVLIDRVPARDSTLFCFGDRWWLFCTYGATPEASWADLFVWHAPRPTGPWEPHRLQPVKRDIRSSRPAGRPFVMEGSLYRPAQDCVPLYGSRIVINRVVTLTPEDFAEEACAYVEPDESGPYRDGLHTISSAGGLMIVDGHRYRPNYNPVKLFLADLQRLRQITT
jgi:hypothetical protein